MSGKTTVLINNQREYATYEKCHGGEGPFLFKDLLGALDEKRFIKYIHDDVIPPGSTFGNHQHPCDGVFEEWYFVISGRGVMQLDGREYEMRAGDISGCFAKGCHGIKNTGTDNLRILVICATSLTQKGSTS